jgi:predicted SnoaL-like aldol condensation-catalyzing enzyme
MKPVSHTNIALSFLSDVIKDKVEEAYENYVSPKFRHHNAHFVGDRKSLKNGMIENEKEFPKKILEVKHAVEEGDMVIVHSHMRFKKTDPGMVMVHIFRFEKDQIIELWDVKEPVLAGSPNKNGTF